MKEYQRRIWDKATRIFDKTYDDKLAQRFVLEADQNTYTDVITGQNRHIMYNIVCLKWGSQRTKTP